MGKLRKIGKKIGRKFKSIGKRLKRGLGKVAKAFGKLGPLGSIALSFILPGMGTWISSLAGQSGFLGTIATGIQNAAGFVGDGVGRVFNRVTDAMEMGMNKVGSLVGRQGTGGSRFRDFVSDVTNGFVKPSDVEAQSLTFDKNMIGTNVDETVTVAKKPDTINFSDKGKEILTSEKPSIVEKGEFDSLKQRTKGSREYATYKTIAPIEKIGSNIIATEDAEKFAAEQARKQKAAYFSDVAQTTLVRGIDPNIGYINFNEANPSEDTLFRLQNSYTGILS